MELQPSAESTAAVRSWFPLAEHNIAESGSLLAGIFSGDERRGAETGIKLWLIGDDATCADHQHQTHRR
jgi:hypothetical protein